MNMMTTAAQAAAWRIRRRNRSAQWIQQATPWSPGLVCPPNSICQSNNLAWQTAEGGTAGTNAPNNSQGPAFFDGGVQWVRVWMLLVAPTPIT